MKKIVFGIEARCSDCELIFPRTDKTNVLLLINQRVVRNDIPYEAVGTSFYGIGFKNGFFVLSKTRIVYGGRSQRIGYLSFIVALKNDEANLNLFDQIEKLENDYYDEKLSEQNDSPEIIKEVNKKLRKNEKPPETIATLYKSDEELKNNFHCLDSYKNYRQIYFIKPEDQKKLENGIKYDHFFDNINEIKKQKENVPLKENDKKLFSFKSIFKR